MRFTLLQFRKLLEELQAIPEGTGTLLDNAGIITATDVNQGYYHDLSDMPVIVAGKAGGALRSGNVYRYLEALTGRAMFTVMKATGSRAPRFGTGALAATSIFPEMVQP